LYITFLATKQSESFLTKFYSECRKHGLYIQLEKFYIDNYCEEKPSWNWQIRLRRCNKEDLARFVGNAHWILLKLLKEKGVL